MDHTPQYRKGLPKKKIRSRSSSQISVLCYLPYMFPMLAVCLLLSWAIQDFPASSCSGKVIAVNKYRQGLPFHSFSDMFGNMKKLPNLRKITTVWSFPAYMESSGKAKQVEGFPESNSSTILVSFSIPEFQSLKCLLHEGSEFPPSTKNIFCLWKMGWTSTQNSTSPLPMEIWQI